MTPKNAHAQALGRLGGLRNSPAQQTARLQNAQKGGRPADFHVLDDGHGTLTLLYRNDAPVRLVSNKALLFLTRWLEQHKPGMALVMDAGEIHYAAVDTERPETG